MKIPLLAILLVSTGSLYAGAYSGPAAGVKITERLPLADFSAQAPLPDAPREFRLVLRDAVTLMDIEKQGIKGGGGVREVPVKVYGSITILLPVRDGKPDFARSKADLQYVGVNRIGFSGPLRDDPANPLQFDGRHLKGGAVFPVRIKLPKQEEERAFDLAILLDLEVQKETFRHTPDPDPSIPPWRSDKTQPSGQKVTGTWRTVERRPDTVLELEGKIAGPRGFYRLSPTRGRFFPVGALDLEKQKSGLGLNAFTAPHRVDGHESQWAVLELPQPVDLRRFTGLRLKVSSPPPREGMPPVAAAVAFRVKGQPWYACRTVTPLLGGSRDSVVDFDLFHRGTANPGYRGGPNTFHFADLSQIDAIAVGVANPFGAGDVSFVAESLEAVRHGDRGAGEPTSSTVNVVVDPAVSESLNGQDRVPKGLFGYHIANSSWKSNDSAPAWFEAEPVSGNLTTLLKLARPGSLRPIDHTNFTAETGAQMIQPLPASIAAQGEATDEILHTVTNENLWARPRWMDADIEAYTAGIREMFKQVGANAWTPEKPDNTLRRIEFWNEPFMWARHINRGQSKLSAGPGDPGGNRGRKAWEDPTQFTFMPGKLGAETYAKFFNAAAEGLKESNPHVQIGGMSSGVFGEDFFSQLTNYVAHFLAASHDKIDFLTEHHYSTHPPSTAAAYEVVNAWSLAKHGKSWPIWNTEANDLDDIAPGDRRSAEAAKAFTDLNRAYYNYRDILELILKSRDIAAGRAIHALWGRGWFKNEGEHHLFLHTADLRGTLLSPASDDPALIPVATWENGRLSIFLLNDSPFPRSANLTLKGLGSAAPPAVSGLRLSPDNAETRVFPSTIRTADKDGDMQITWEQPLAPREIAKVVLKDVAAPAKIRRFTTHPSDLVVVDVSPGKPLRGRIRVDSSTLESATKARLRVVTRDVQTGEAVLKIGSMEIPLPPSNAEGGHHVIQEIPLDIEPAKWKSILDNGALPIVATAASGNDGFALYSASLLLEAPGVPSPGL